MGDSIAGHRSRPVFRPEFPVACRLPNDTVADSKGNTTTIARGMAGPVDWREGPLTGLLQRWRACRRMAGIHPKRSLSLRDENCSSCPSHCLEPVAGSQ